MQGSMASPDFRTAFRNGLKFGIKIVQFAKSHVIWSTWWNSTKQQQIGEGESEQTEYLFYSFIHCLIFQAGEKLDLAQTS